MTRDRMPGIGAPRSDRTEQHVDGIVVSRRTLAGFVERSHTLHMQKRRNADTDRKGTVRDAAVRIGERVESRNAWCDRLLDRELRTRTWSMADRRLLTELVFGVQRHRKKLDWVIDRVYRDSPDAMSLSVRSVVRVGVYQLLFLDRVPASAAVNESVETAKRCGLKRASSLVNGLLRNVQRRRDEFGPDHPAGNDTEAIATRLSHPEWMVGRYRERFDLERCTSILAANNTIPPLTIRCRPGLDQDVLIERLEDQNVAVERSVLHPSFLRLRGASDIRAYPEWQRGEINVQDESGGLIASLCSIRPGMRVLDLCAAPGGKTIAMGELLEGNGTIEASDRNDARLNLVRDAAQRCGLERVIETRTGDAALLETEPADLVLLDAPCTGLGVVRRKPEIKWRRTSADIERLSAIQSRLLDHASTLVRPGGAIVYSTCTVEPEENGDVVRRFLESHPQFQIESARSLLPEAAVEAGAVSEDGFLETWSDLHKCDGSFGARLVLKG